MIDAFFFGPNALLQNFAPLLMKKEINNLLQICALKAESYGYLLNFYEFIHWSGKVGCKMVVREV
jgi:hypothetical protein